MNRYRRNVVAGVCLAATAAFGQSAVANDGNTSYEGMSGKELANACSMLDNPKYVQRMDGLINYLAIKCNRRDMFGGAESAKYDKDKSTNRIPGTDVPVNDPSGDSGASQTQNETSIAISPVTGTLCSGFNDSFSGVTAGGGFTGFARSTDGGASFVDNGAFDNASSGDPSMIWRQADGNFYLATLRNGGLGIYRSTDDCQTMDFISQAATGSDDKELLAVDNNVGSPNFGRIYMVWTDFGQGAAIFSSFSDDGINWSPQVQLSDNGASVQGAWPIVAPDGTFYVAWVRFNPFPLGPIDMELSRSTDGGQTFTRGANALTGAVSPNDNTAFGACGRPALNGNIRYLSSPQIAVTPNGDLHIVYTYDPGTANVGDASDVFYRRSTDMGDTWGPEIRINDDATETDQFFPSLSSGPTGRIVIAWYDRRLDPDDNLFVDYYATVSDDGGLTFGPNERVSDESSPIRLDPNLATCYHGDYDQQLQTVSSAFIQWADDRRISSNGSNDPDTYIDENVFEPDFFVTGDTTMASVCAPDDAVYDITIGQALGFSDPVNMSAAGNPAGTTASFSVNPVIPAGATTLTIGSTGSAAPGNYTIEVSGVSGTKTRTAQLALALSTDTPDAAALSMPADGSTEQSTQPTFTWAAAAQAGTYLVEVALDAGFANIIESGTTETTSYTATSSLGPMTTYFWRVTASNQCGGGDASATFSFTTQNIICVSPNLSIPDGDGAGIDSDTSLAATGTLEDIDVTLKVTHTYVGDLIFTLTHEDTGTSATFYDRPGVPATTFGCSGNDIDATFDDEATTPLEDECSDGPAIGGSFIPSNPLDVFDGEDLSGTWTMNVSDNAGVDTGTLDEWCLLPVTMSTGVDSDDDGVLDDVDNCTSVANADQRDSNGDGFGNACDADLNNDCTVNVVDLGILRSVFFSGNADADLNGDGVVNVADLGLLRLAFFGPPGPAAEPNGCSVN
ncbi:MAG: proprotein convertase P-domain-containing protein [Gammaproteobacteria bacterium]